MSQKHPDFSTLAARIAVSNLHKNTSDSFSETCRVLYGYKDKDAAVMYKRDYVHGKIVERPQHMLLRVACGIHSGDVKAAIETYDLMSRRYFTHATPTLFNAGTPQPQMSSCFLLVMKNDSIDSIYDTLKQCALISKSAGGIGVAVSNIRAKGAYIRGTNGYMTCC